MSDADVISAQSRTDFGRGASRAARRSGRVPGVVYGAGKDTISISLDRRQLDREMGAAASIRACTVSGSTINPNRCWHVRFNSTRHGRADARGFPPPVSGLHDTTADSRAFRERRGVTGPQTRWGAERGTPRGRGQLSSGRDPGKLHRGSHGPRHWRRGAYQRYPVARRRRTRDYGS